jgi:hypothetical protein
VVDAQRPRVPQAGPRRGSPSATRRFPEGAAPPGSPIAFRRESSFASSEDSVRGSPFVDSCGCLTSRAPPPAPSAGAPPATCASGKPPTSTCCVTTVGWIPFYAG